MGTALQFGVHFADGCVVVHAVLLAHLANLTVHHVPPVLLVGGRGGEHVGDGADPAVGGVEALLQRQGFALVVQVHLGLQGKHLAGGRGLGFGCGQLLGAEVGLDQAALHFPSPIVGEGLDNHQIAGFGDEGDAGRRAALGTLDAKRPNFGRLVKDKVILALHEPLMVVVEALSGAAFGAVVNSVDVAECQNRLTVQRLGGELGVADGHKVVHL